MRVEHGDSALADDVKLLDGYFEQIRGLMLRDRLPDGSAAVLQYGSVSRRPVHTALMRFPIDVVWVADGEATAVETMAPWSLASHEADTVVELPAGAAGRVMSGDPVSVRG